MRCAGGRDGHDLQGDCAARDESVVRLLPSVLDKLVCVGGCTAGLITDPVVGGIRPMEDVDAIVDVTSYAKYTSLGERVRTLGRLALVSLVL